MVQHGMAWELLEKLMQFCVCFALVSPISIQFEPNKLHAVCLTVH
jgi:hypothetical protein